MESEKTTEIISSEKVINNLIKRCNLEETCLSHIKYDNTVNNNYDFQIVRSSTNDGTLLFLIELLNECAKLIINKEVYCKSNAPEDLDTIIDIKYTIGDFKVDRDIGTKEIRGQKMMGETDIVSLPVKVEYIY